MTNILSLEDYIEYLSGKGLICCDDSDCPTTRSEAEYRYSDFCVEQINFQLRHHENGDFVWYYRNTIDTGGYNELYDVREDYQGFFNRCVCDCAQFTHYSYSYHTKTRIPEECPHCWLKREEEEE